MAIFPDRTRRLVSEVRADGTLALRVEQIPCPAPAAGELLLRVEAAPVHPTDAGQMLLAGDLARAERDGDSLVMPLQEAARSAFASQAGRVTPLGSEGAGTVIAVGDPADEALVGRRVASFGAGMYAEYRVLNVADVTALPEDVSARDGAAITVNPMTALAMVETMRIEGAEALVHTAAASSLGQMLQRICAQDGIPLINIVRRPEQVALLREAGAAYVLNSEDPDFVPRLVDALVETNATMAFDAVGGGTLAGSILTAMEQAQLRRATGPTFYGSAVRKRAYIYGRLSLTPTVIPPTTGMAWDVGGFLLFQVLDKFDLQIRERMKRRVLDELTSTFAMHYAAEVGLDALLDPETLVRVIAKATGAKFLVCPQSGMSS